MTDLKDKVVFISGANSGIGASCADAFAKKGARLIMCARNMEKLEKVASEISEKYDTDIITYKLDVSNRNAVMEMFSSLDDEWKDIDILINNAGGALGLEKLHEGCEDDWDEMIDTNVKGLLYLTRKIVPEMVKTGKAGHIINIGSIAGVAAYPNGAVYCACKSAVRAISDGLRMDTVDTQIRVTNVQPGLVETNFSVVRFHGDIEKAEKVYKGLEALTADDIADLCVYCAEAPKHVQICEVTVTPTNQASGTVVHRS